MSVLPRVLIVDDSAFARKVVREILERSGRVEVVGIARDGLEALEAIQELHPDVMTLDLMMPDLDGLGVLDALVEGGPAVVVVSVSGSDTKLGAAALMKGAIGLVEKPSALATERMYEMGEELLAKVLAAAAARPRFGALPLKPPVRAVAGTRFQLLVIGASTGGPRAISSVLSALPAELPVPVVAALHIPYGYTHALAERIAANAHLKVVEGADRMPLVPGTAIVVPGGSHSQLTRSGSRILLSVTGAMSPMRSFTPSIDLLFESAARVASPVLGVVLTGMGDDGTIGAKAIKAAGGAIVTEAEESCVVFGMPRSVRDAGLSDESAPLDEIPSVLFELFTEKPA